MSLPQFERFYWPQYKALIEGLADAGIRPTVGYEGRWDQRLHYLTELPKGKHAGWFDRTDIFKAKEVVGDIMCICGGMPDSLLQGGAPEQVRDSHDQAVPGSGQRRRFPHDDYHSGNAGLQTGACQGVVDTTKEYGVYT